MGSITVMGATVDDAVSAVQRVAIIWIPPATRIDRS